ncbi:MAG: BatA domain-containing protein [Planctomycetes bacterium]|nr:BatA domain-containing protein [Planctomycetota bacterium]
MTFDRPQAWALLALAVPIVVLHLRFRKRRDAEVPSLSLWRDLVPAGVGRRGFRRVEDASQLACLLAALVAFTAALAGPVTGGSAPQARRLAIVVDASASMNALVPRPAGSPPDAFPSTRFEAARAAALAAVGKLGPKDELVVWEATARPRVVVEPTTDAAAARVAISRLAPTLETCGLRRTLDLVRLSLGRDDAADVVVLTDAVGAHDLAAWGELPPTWRVGAAGAPQARNAGIVAADVDVVGTGRTSGSELRLRARVARTDGGGGRRTLVLRSPTAEVARADVDVPESGSVDAVLPLDSVTAGGPLVLRLEPTDDFPEDDVAVMLLAAPKRLVIALAAPSLVPSPFLVATLRAMPDRVDAERAVLTGPDAPASAFADADVIVAEDRLPPAAPRDRPTLLFGAAGRSGSGPIDRPLVWGTGRHAVLDGVDLAPLRIDRASVLDVGPSDRVLIECAEGPVAVASEGGGVRRLRFGFRPDATTLPLEPAFPLIVRNALRWLARPPLLPPSVRAGGPMATAEPVPAVERLWFVGPGARPPQPVIVRDGALVEVAPFPAPLGPGGLDFEPPATPVGVASTALRVAAASARLLRVRGLPGDPATAVNWFPADGFHLVPDVPRAPDVADVVAALPDRGGTASRRAGWAAACALAGVAALVLGTLAMNTGRQRTTAPTGV